MNTMPEGGMAPQRGWWSRNWKWMVPMGCLGLLLSCGCLGALLFVVTSKTLQSTGAFAEAITLAKQSPEVREALGEPIETGLMLQGSIETEDERGSANFSVPLDGANADGTLYVEAYKDGNKWMFTTLEVEIPGRPNINLLGDAPAPPPDTVPFPDSLPDVEPLPGDAEPEDPPEGREDIQL